MDELTLKLSNISKESNNEGTKMKQIIQNIAIQDETKESYEYLDEDEREYMKINDAYKQYISQYSKAYIEMCDHYYGPELPYDIYCREFKNGKNGKNGETYLDSPSDVKELYALFMFFTMFELSVGKVVVPA